VLQRFSAKWLVRLKLQPSRTHLRGSIDTSFVKIRLKKWRNGKRKARKNRKYLGPPYRSYIDGDEAQKSSRCHDDLSGSLVLEENNMCLLVNRSLTVLFYFLSGLQGNNVLSVQQDCRGARRSQQRLWFIHIMITSIDDTFVKMKFRRYDPINAFTLFVLKVIFLALKLNHFSFD